MATTLTIPSELDAAERAEEAVLREVARHRYGESVTFAIKLALEEGLSNAIKHGNACDCRKQVTIAYQIDDRRATICITDQGEGFDLGAVPDPTTDENLEKPDGRGIMLMRAYMDKVRYNRRGNRLYMVKLNTPDDTG